MSSLSLAISGGSSCARGMPSVELSRSSCPEAYAWPWVESILLTLCGQGLAVGIPCLVIHFLPLIRIFLFCSIWSQTLVILGSGPSVLLPSLTDVWGGMCYFLPDICPSG